MALLQIAEPGMSGDPHKHNFAIGIDLGTTNSLVAVVKSGDTVIIKNGEGDELIPSVVSYLQNNQIIVGNHAVAQKLTNPSSTISSVKRFIGRSRAELGSNFVMPYKFTNKDNIIEIITDQGVKNPIQISADILHYLKDMAKDNLGEDPVGAVITVPAYFDDAQRQATKQAAKLAGLDVLRLLNEPTAAAIAYGLDANKDGTIIVFDLGGGTLDVSVLRLSNGVFEVLAVSGDTQLGGDDFDHRLYCYILNKSNLSQLNDQDAMLLLSKSKMIKEQLSTQSSVAFMCVLSCRRVINLTITREEFNEITQSLVDKSLLPLKKVMRDTGLSVSDIDQIVMVGGSTRMLNIRNAVEKFFNRTPLTSIDPDKVVAIGAAISANSLVGNKNDNELLLLDVTPLSLGIETMGELVEKIIPRNSPIPITKAQEFTTYKDGQTAMMIHVLQGERELVKDCRSLAKFTLRGIPPMTASIARVLVTFQVDADGLLSVSAEEKTTGIISQIEVKPSFGLGEDEISKMLQDSITNANQDIQLRQLNEAKIDATTLLDVVDMALKKDAELLDSESLELIKDAIKQLRNCYNDNSLDVVSQTKQLKILAKNLNEVTSRFAAMRMNKAVSEGLSGKSVDNVII